MHSRSRFINTFSEWNSQFQNTVLTLPEPFGRRRTYGGGGGSNPPLTLLTAQLTIKPRGVALTIISVKISIKVVRTTRREVRWAKGSSWLTAVYWFVIFWIWILPKMAYHFWSLLGTLCSCTQSHIIYVSRLVSCFLLVQWHRVEISINWKYQDIFLNGDRGWM